MRQFLLFILPILTIVVLSVVVFGSVQNGIQKEKAFEDLVRKVKAIAETTELSAQRILKEGDTLSANKLVESFQKREKMQGCIIYDINKTTFAITPRIVSWHKKDDKELSEVANSRLSSGNFKNMSDYSVYRYIIPVTDNDAALVGFVEILYDSSFIVTMQYDYWKRIGIFLFALTALLIFIVLLLQRQIFFVPLKRLTDWFHLFQKGTIESTQPLKNSGVLGKLAVEVEQVALDLRIARKIVTDNATEHLNTSEKWTEAKLRNLVHAKLGENALFVVSNREPYIHIHDYTIGKTKCVRPAGGVVTALHPILSACGGTWIAHGSGDDDKKFVNSKNKLGVPPQDNRYILKRVWLSKEEEEGYYYGFANEGLWPLCHNTHARPAFRENDWQAYKAVNKKFADAILEELPSNNPFLFIQDYHFTLLPKYIKEKRPDVTIAMFWHIPWPNPEAFSICPYQVEILDGLLGCDLIGFHVHNHCNNFLETANRLIESKVDIERRSVMRFGKETLIRPFPISIDSTHLSNDFSSDIVQQISSVKKEYNLEKKIIAIGVDRIDYTKGIIERMLAIECFLEKYPEYIGSFSLIQVGSPSRTHIKRYHALVSEIDELVERINWKYKNDDWKPIIYLKRHFSPEEIEPLYAMADLCIVSSLHDGMNLVAKEYVFSKKDDTGVLLLSQFTGAAKELTDAILINPYSIEEFAEHIRTSIEMPLDEKKRRMQNMRSAVEQNNVYKWAGKIITELTNIKN